jgi:hypothetical protein
MVVSGGGAELAGATRAVSGMTAGPRLAVPLTEQILSLLRGPRLAWVIAWALVPWLNLGVIVALGAAGWARTGIPLVEVLNRTAVSFAVLLSIWGAARITDELRTLPLALANVVEQEKPDVQRLFRGIDSTLGPLVLTAATGQPAERRRGPGEAGGAHPGVAVR